MVHARRDHELMYFEIFITLKSLTISLISLPPDSALLSSSLYLMYVHSIYLLHRFFLFLFVTEIQLYESLIYLGSFTTNFTTHLCEFQFKEFLWSIIEDNNNNDKCQDYVKQNKIKCSKVELWKEDFYFTFNNTIQPK